ncbi:unnamed protein product [Symbiodinium microadriaticum]|nr:unnamed protein product [Symbiodinium microadriaticum]
MPRKIFWKMTMSPPSWMATCQLRPKRTCRRCRTTAAWKMCPWLGTSLPTKVTPGTRQNLTMEKLAMPRMHWKMTMSPSCWMAICPIGPLRTWQTCRTAAMVPGPCKKACPSWGTSPTTIAMPGTRPKFPSTSPLSRRPSMSRKICWMMTTSPPSWMATCQMRSSPQLVCEPSVAQGRLPSSEVKLAVDIQGNVDQNAAMHPVEDRRERVGGEQQPLGSFKTWV